MAAGSQRERISDDALAEATGRDWQGWLTALDERGARNCDHQAIVALVAEIHDEASGWWQQTIAVGYEQERGLREVGQTADQGFEIGVRKTVPLEPAEAWRLLTGADALGRWVGGWVPQLEEGARFTAVNGSTGEVRTIRAGERLRLRWSPARTERDTVLQLSVTPAKTGTTIGVHHEKLADERERELMRIYWKRALDRLARQAEQADGTT